MKTKLHEVRERIAEALLEQGNAIQRAVEGLDDGELLELARWYVLRGNRNNHGLRNTHWDEVADKLRGERRYRRILARARASGLPSYCPTCDGACKGEAEHDRRHPGLPAWQMALFEKSRDELMVRLAMHEQTPEDARAFAKQLLGWLED